MIFKRYWSETVKKKLNIGIKYLIDARIDKIMEYCLPVFQSTHICIILHYIPPFPLFPTIQ